MTSYRLSERERAALAALAALAGPADGHGLAARMNDDGFKANQYSAHQSANGLVNKGLAVKGPCLIDGTSCIGYELTSEGHSAAARIGGTS